MEVFISWSGSRSEKIAEALRVWLPKVIQTLKPWMSATDIEKGTRWAHEIAAHLEKIKFGLICLTSDNLDAPWILFEAGALSKTLDGTNVVPYLFELSPSQLRGPLTQFQAVESTKSDTKGLLQTMNRLSESDAVSDSLLDETFEKWWPDLEKALQGIPAITGEVPSARADRDILEEILNLVRIQSRPTYSSSQEDAFAAFAEPRISREGANYRYTGYDGVSFLSKRILSDSEALETIFDIRNFLDRPMATSSEQSTNAIDDFDDIQKKSDGASI